MSRSKQLTRKYGGTKINPHAPGNVTDVVDIVTTKKTTERFSYVSADSGNTVKATKEGFHFVPSTSPNPTMKEIKSRVTDSLDQAASSANTSHVTYAPSEKKAQAVRETPAIPAPPRRTPTVTPVQPIENSHHTIKGPDIANSPKKATILETLRGKVRTRTIHSPPPPFKQPTPDTVSSPPPSTSPLTAAYTPPGKPPKHPNGPTANLRTPPINQTSRSKRWTEFAIECHEVEGSVTPRAIESWRSRVISASPTSSPDREVSPFK